MQQNMLLPSVDAADAIMTPQAEHVYSVMLTWHIKVYNSRHSLRQTLPVKIQQMITSKADYKYQQQQYTAETEVLICLLMLQTSTVFNGNNTTMTRHLFIL